MSEFVCADCFGDSGIATFVADSVEANYCSFCSEKSDEPVGARVDEVGEYINICLEEVFGDAVEELPWDSEEWGYFGGNWDTYELMTEVIELDLPNDHHGNDWC